MRIGDILDGAVKLYRARWKALMAIVAVLVVPLNFLEAYVTRHLPPAFARKPFPSGSEHEVVWLVILSALYFLLFFPLLAAGVARGSVKTYLGQEVDVGDTYRFALRLVPSLLWILLLTFLAMLLGFVLLVIPGIIAMIRLSFATVIRVTEGHRGGAAISRSWHLSEGYFWKILWTGLVAGIFAALIGGLLVVPTELLFSHLGPDAWLLSAVGSSIAETITTPYVTLVTVLLYLDLRIRKEGLDLEVLSQEMGSP
jgi:hypothetical protein